MRLQHLNSIYYKNTPICLKPILNLISVAQNQTNGCNLACVARKKSCVIKIAHVSTQINSILCTRQERHLKSDLAFQLKPSRLDAELSSTREACHAKPCHAMSWHVVSCRFMSCHVISLEGIRLDTKLSCTREACHACRVISCRVMSCHVMSCHVLSCLVMSSVGPEWAPY